MTFSSAFSALCPGDAQLSGLQRVLDALPVVVWIDDPSQRQIIFSNRALDELWDIDFGNDRRVERLLERIHPDDLADFTTRLGHYGADGFSLDYRIIRRDGSIRWLRSRGVPVHDASGTMQLVVGTTQDVTAEHEHSESERQMLCRLLQADRLATLGALSAALAHDVRHHLHGLTMAAGVVSELVADVAIAVKDGSNSAAAVTALCQQGPELMRGVAESLARLQAQVNEMRQHGREQRPEQPQRFDAASTIRSVLRLSEPYLRGRGAALQVDIPEGACWQTGWSTQVEQAALNLLTNAAEALDRPGLPVRVSLTADATHWILAIEDGGPGIPADMRTELGRTARTTKPDGTGLGWAIIARCMQRHGGTWTISELSSRGTRIELIFPIA
jgi:signal transduction histidine kinase